MKQFDLIALGNATIDAFLGIHDASVHCHVNEKDRELSFAYGEKITLDTCDFQLGGNACNVSVGLSRMGFLVALVAETGDDEFSHKILNSLAKEKVDQAFIQQTKGAASSFAIGINFKQERTLFVKHTVRKHDFTLDTATGQWMYLSSLGYEWREAYKKALEHAQKNNIKIAFNPGTPQLAEGYGGIADILRSTEILFVNKEEAKRIMACSEGCECPANSSMQELLLDLQGCGPQIIVVTDGQNGSFVIDTDKNTYSLNIFDHQVVERTGAGDAYTAGFLSAMIQGEDIPNAMKWGTINAASVIGKVGAQPGLLTKLEMEKKLLEHTDLKVKQA